MHKEKVMVRNASDPEQVKRAKIKNEIDQNKESDDLRFLLENPHGRRFIWRMMGHCGIYKSPYHHNGSQQNLNIGRAEVARWLLSEIINVDQEYWLLMQKENLKQGDF